MCRNILPGSPVPAENKAAAHGVNALFPTGMTQAELHEACGFAEKFRAQQLYRWITQGAPSFAHMSNLPITYREALTARFGALYSSRVSEEKIATDGSLKLQLRLRDGAAVECVLLEDIEGRKTACLSSQVGCAMGCRFCRTGQLGFLRNLSPDEIMEQFYYLSARRGKISNIVFMGMGEPLRNLASVRRAIALFSDARGIGISLRKITISTCGVVPGIIDLADHGPAVRLALSLTVADDAMRTELMPVNATWNLAALKSALLYYQSKTRDRITLETVLTGNRNCTPEAAQQLLRWVSPLRLQINSIPWNPVPGMDFTEPSEAQVRAFTAVLEGAGLTVNRRMSRGRGVCGACGQLGDTLQAAQ